MEDIMNENERRVETRENILRVMEKTFVMVPAKLLHDVAERKITSSAFQLYCYLLFRRGRKDKFWGSIKEICWGTGFSEAQVSRLLKKLETRGHIKRAKRVSATWLTYCLTYVDESKIVYRGKPVHPSSMDAATDGNSARKTLASDGKRTEFPEVQSGKCASNDEVSEAVRLFDEEVCRQQAKVDQLRRELGIHTPSPSAGRLSKLYYSKVSNHY